MTTRRQLTAPPVGELRKRLGYGDASLDRCKSFYEDCRVFIKRFTTEKSIRGPYLLDRRSRDHMDGLREMANAFLNEANFGNIYWPNDETNLNYNRYQYCNHQEDIQRDMELLFYKINHQADQNKRYKAKNGVNSTREPALGEQGARGTSVNDPIDIDNELPKTATTQQTDKGRSNQPKDKSLIGSNGPASPNKSKPAIASSSRAPAPLPRLDTASTQASQATDPYAVPEEFPPVSHLFIGPGQKPAAATSTSTVDRAKAKSSKRTSTADTQNPRKKAKKPSDPKPQRKSTRSRRPIHQNLAFPILSPTPSTHSTADDSEIPGTSFARSAVAAQAQRTPTAITAEATATEATTSSDIPNTAAAAESRTNSQEAITNTCAAPESNTEPQENAERRERMPYAQMADVQSASLPRATVSESRASPPAPELSSRAISNAERNMPIQSTEREQENVAASSLEERLRTTSASREPSFPRLTLERTPVQAEHAKVQEQEAEPESKQQASVIRDSATLSAAPASTAPVEPDVRIVVISQRPKRTASYWTPSESLKNKKFAQLKEEIPLELGPEFRGFKFSFVGPNEKSVWEVLDGNELEFEYVKMNIYESIEDCVEKMKDSAAKLAFLLRIEELHDAQV